MDILKITSKGVNFEFKVKNSSTMSPKGPSILIFFFKWVQTSAKMATTTDQRNIITIQMTVLFGFIAMVDLPRVVVLIALLQLTILIQCLEYVKIQTAIHVETPKRHLQVNDQCYTVS